MSQNKMFQDSREAEAFLQQARKTFIELHQSQDQYARQLQQTKINMQSKDREAKKAELCRAELAQIPSSSRTFAQVGKMFVLESRQDVDNYLRNVEKTAKKEESDLQDREKYIQNKLREIQQNIYELQRTLPR